MSARDDYPPLTLHARQGSTVLGMYCALALDEIDRLRLETEGPPAPRMFSGVYVPRPPHIEEVPCPDCGGPTRVELIPIERPGQPPDYIQGQRSCIDDCRRPGVRCAACGGRGFWFERGRVLCARCEAAQHGGEPLFWLGNDEVGEPVITERIRRPEVNQRFVFDNDQHERVIVGVYADLIEYLRVGDDEGAQPFKIDREAFTAHARPLTTDDVEPATDSGDYERKP